MNKYKDKVYFILKIYILRLERNKKCPLFSNCFSLLFNMLELKLEQSQNMHMQLFMYQISCRSYSCLHRE